MIGLSEGDEIMSLYTEIYDLIKHYEDIDVFNSTDVENLHIGIMEKVIVLIKDFGTLKEENKRLKESNLLMENELRKYGA